MPWYKNKQALLAATILCLAFLVEGFLFSGFFKITNIESLNSFVILTITFCVAVALLLTNSLTLILLVYFAKLRKGALQSLNDKIGIINFTLIFLVLPLYLSTLIWSVISKWIIFALGGVAYMSGAIVFVLFVLNVIIFSVTVYYTPKPGSSKGE